MTQGVLSFEELKSVPFIHFLRMAHNHSSKFNNDHLKHVLLWLAVAWHPSEDPLHSMNGQELKVLLDATVDPEEREKLSNYLSGRHCSAVSLTNLIKDLYNIAEDDESYAEEIKDVAKRYNQEILKYSSEQLVELILFAYPDEEEFQRIVSTFPIS